MRQIPRRVWITGIGVVTPIGIGLEAFWEGLRAGRSPIRPIGRFDPASSSASSRLLWPAVSFD